MKTAQDIITILNESSDVELTTPELLAALEDGEALASLGITDADQGAVEEAHALLQKTNKQKD